MSRLSRLLVFAVFVVLALAGCDDGVLRAFEPRPGAFGGAGNFGGTPGAGGTGGVGRGGGGTDRGGNGGVSGGGKAPNPEGGGGRGGTTPVEPMAGAAGDGTPGAPQPLIDDFEDGDMHAKAPIGWWYPVNDGTGTQGTGIEPVNGASGSVYALRTHGSGFTDWGAAVGVNLAGDAMIPLDAQAFERLCFRARVEPGDSSSLQVHLLRDPGVHYRRDVSLSESWTRYCLPLGDFVSTDQQPLVPDRLIAIQFFFAPNAPFELWLDDVEFEP